MKENLNKKINEILDSTKGSQRAKPSNDLLAKIENQIYQQEATIIPLGRLKLVAAVAVFLLLVNGLAISTYLNQVHQPTEYAEQALIMDYKLYE
ncbi:MAG: hypothetical protein AB8G86_24180 [Saprospiraceae bacterium]